MPAPMKVELLPHDPQWAANAARESETIARALGPCLRIVHHIGSTAIPGIRAKPVLDLLPVVRDLSELDALRHALEAAGYEWWGEYGLPGRRFCTRADPITGRRLVNLHGYEEGSPEIARHLAFRDRVRAEPMIAQAYEREKVRCQRLHLHDSHAYTDCKSAWIQKIEAEALRKRGD